MCIKIDDTRMTLTLDGKKIAEAIQAGDVWHVSTWPVPLSYNQAITALTLAEWLATGQAANAPFAVAWREELPT
ncbi:hypothetical protein AB0L06_30765 [Spirillospora sp. NPDC052269]